VVAEAFSRTRERGERLIELRRLVGLEGFKLRRRPLPRILLLFLAGITFFVPLLFFLVLGGPEDDPAGIDQGKVVSRTVFPGVLEASVENAISFGVLMLIVLTAASFGGEFAWGTIRLLLARGEGRGAYAVSKLAALLLWWLLALTIGTGMALLAATLIGLVDGEPGPASVGALDWLAGGGRFVLAWAASSVYAALTAFFAIRFRSTAIGLAIGLGTWFGVGTPIGVAGGLDVAVFDLFVRAGVTYNLRSLLGTLDGRANPFPLAVIVLLMCAIATILGAIHHFRRNDVTVAGIG
jgi:ABC-type transport system involved in multi-copper enzyme maturation permease subunit